jgi:hypothetical protein
MEDFVPERIRIRGFGGYIWAEGRGTMVVWAKAPGYKEKSQELRIHNALYCPDGPVSLISGKALNRNGIFKNEEKNVLYTRKRGYQVIAKLQSINDQAVIEYNSPNQASAYALKASKLLTTDKNNNIFKHINRSCSRKSRASKSQGVEAQESNPSLDSRDFDAEAIKQLQMETAQEPIKQASRPNEISATLLETNIISRKRSERAPKQNDAVVYFTSTFALSRALQDEQKSIPEVRLHRDNLPREQATNMARNNEAIQTCLHHIDTHNHWLRKKWCKTRKSTSARLIPIPC